MIASIQQSEITCSGCGKQQKAKPTPKGNLRPPMGWKRVAEAIYCPACKDSLYRVRAVTFPVATVLEGGEWKDFLAALRDAWGRSTRLANWAVRQLLKFDEERKPGQEKMHALPRVDLYKHWQEHYERDAWTGGAAAANSVIQATEKKYRARRYDMLWLGQSSAPRHNYPMPYPIHNKDWTPVMHETEGEDGQKMLVPAVSINLGGKRWLLRLRGGFNYQLASFKQLVSGEALKGELAVYRRRSNGSKRRTGSEGKTSYRIMVKMVASLPREERKKNRRGTLEVRTARNALIVAMGPNWSKPWLYHADHMRRWVHVYRGKRQNMADDLKAEQRPASAGMLERYAILAKRHDDRMKTFIHTLAAMLSGLADRCKFSEIRYDDTDKRYTEEFPWARLRELVAEKCGNVGVKFTHASGEVVNETTEIARGENGESQD